MREEMATGEEDGNDHSSLPLSMERDVIMADSDVNDGHDDYSPLSVHSSLGLGNAGHRSLFSVTPCSIEYQYWSTSRAMMILIVFFFFLATSMNQSCFCCHDQLTNF